MNKIKPFERVVLKTDLEDLSTGHINTIDVYSFVKEVNINGGNYVLILGQGSEKLVFYSEILMLDIENTYNV